MKGKIASYAISLSLLYASIGPNAINPITAPQETRDEIPYNGTKIRNHNNVSSRYDARVARKFWPGR